MGGFKPCYKLYDIRCNYRPRRRRRVEAFTTDAEIIRLIRRRVAVFPTPAEYLSPVDTSRHEVARGHCDRRPRHCCMSHSDELFSANALSALQHHLSGTLSLSPFRTVTRLHYLINLDLKHICSPPSMLLNCPVRQRL